MGKAPYGANMFLPCCAGWDHTGAVRRHVVCIRADNCNGSMAIVTTEGENDGMNNERRVEQQKGQEEEGGEGQKRSAATKIGVS